MTFSIAARCDRTGMLGAAVSSSSICVASRCAFVRAGVGAALSQNITDPRLGPAMLDLVDEGLAARHALKNVVNKTEDIDFRQLGVIDNEGQTACYSGVSTLGRYAIAEGENCFAMGNLLANETVPNAIVEAFQASNGHLGLRLLTALQAGLAAGGEAGPVRSAGVLVAYKVPWPIVDLRVDWDKAPIERLLTIWEEYEPQIEDYLVRALDPSAAPSYGVPGEQ